MSGDGEIGLREFARGDLEWLVDRHGAHYTASDGFDASFPALVRQVAEGFIERSEPPRERAWVAAAGARRLGTIFCAEGPEPEEAQLRLFFVEREARGRGLGRRLLTTCLDHARSAGFARMVLWTHESHATAGRLYRGFGFELAASDPVRSYGVDLVRQHWRRAL